jgi:hypothetical protein
MLQHLGSHIELVGSDVNLVFRLTKNSIIQKTGFKAYAAYTQAAVDALDIGGLCGQMTRHTESYEHLGDVAMHVQDMRAVWEREQASVRTVVEPEKALFTIEHDFTMGPSLLWDCLTKPEYRAIVMGSDPLRVSGRSDGRIGPGSVYYCAHGFAPPQTIVDWQPFEQLTLEDKFMGAAILTTLRLKPVGTGTRLIFLCGRSTGSLLGRIVSDLDNRFTKPRSVRKGFRELQALVDKETAEGKIVQSVPAGIAPERVGEPVAESR